MEKLFHYTYSIDKATKFSRKHVFYDWCDYSFNISHAKQRGAAPVGRLDKFPPVLGGTEEEGKKDRNADTGQGGREAEQDKRCVPDGKKVHRIKLREQINRKRYFEYKGIHSRCQRLADHPGSPKKIPQHHDEKNGKCSIQAENKILHDIPPKNLLLIVPPRFSGSGRKAAG